MSKNIFSFDTSNINIVDNNYILKERNSAITYIIDEYGFTESMAIKALEKFNWKTNIVEKRISNGEYIPECVEYLNTDTNMLICNICLCEYNKTSEGFALDTCGHFLCKECYKNYINETINNKNANLKCLSCDEIIPDGVLKHFLTKEKYDIYINNIIKKYIKSQKDRLINCTNNKCDKILMFDEKKLLSENEILMCSCGNTICLSCCNESHNPINCEMFKQWNDITEDKNFDLNKKWLLINTKPCPECHVAIEKIPESCKHMKCVNCEHEYCWKCLENWRTHFVKNADNFKCYNEESLEFNENYKKIKINTNKYEFYSNIYNSYITKSKYIYNLKDIIMSLLTNENTYDRLKKTLVLALIGLSKAYRELAFTQILSYFSNLGNKNMFQFLIKEIIKQLETLENIFNKIIYEENYIINKCNTILNIISFENDITDKCRIIGEYFNKMIEYLTVTYINEKSNDIEEQTIDEIKKEPKLWKCSMCTYVNKTIDDNCIMCKSEKIHGEILD